MYADYFKDKVAVITGGSSGIGLAVKKAFELEGARTINIDISRSADYRGNVAVKEVLEDFSDLVRKKFGRVDFLINNAPPLFKGINECSYEEFDLSLRIGAVAPFYLTKLLLLAITLAGRIRVNSVSPGWINTHDEILSEEDNVQQPVGRVGTPQDIADTVLFLCSNKAGFITAQDITVDGGMTKQMIYHNDNNWKLELR